MLFNVQCMYLSKEIEFKPSASTLFVKVKVIFIQKYIFF